MKVVDLNQGTPVPTEIDGLTFVCASPLNANQLAVLYSDAKPDGVWVEGDGESKWQFIEDPSGKALIALLSVDGSAVLLPRFNVGSRWLKFAMLPNGGWCVGRSDTQPKDSSSNDVCVFDRFGTQIANLNSSWATEFVQSSKDGHIWIGHNDEGPVNLGGITCLGADGSFRYYIDLAGVIGTPTDDGMPFWCCYALNALENTCWAQHYTSMLMTEFHPDGTAVSWHTENNGALAIAVAPPLLARIGRYEPNKLTISVFKLGKAPTSKRVATIGITIKGASPKDIDSVEGKSDTFHFVHDNVWYRLSISDILAAVG